MQIRSFSSHVTWIVSLSIVFFLGVTQSYAKVSPDTATLQTDGTEISTPLATTIALVNAQAGVFRFLTQSLPDGTTNGEYSAVIFTANAYGNVTYGVSAGVLPDGLSIAGATGQISGLPTKVSQFDVTFSANDGTSTINLAVTMKISAAGGGGNSGAAISNTSLSDGRVGMAYTDTTIMVQSGVGPFIICVEGLPAGLNMNGITGVLSGTPEEAGRFFATFTATDKGENDNKIIKILPVLVLPATSDFKFTTTILNNGEIGTAYQQPILVSGDNGAVAYSASGLPSGLSIASDTGIISGTPSESGKFMVNIAAHDDETTISSNLFTLIVPSSTSHFYWDFAGIPAVIYNVQYGRQPPILIAAVNGSSVTYSALGLPQGIIYNSGTGELSGITVNVGIFPVTFTATNGPEGEVLVYSADFFVFPPSGGDASHIAVNLWIVSQKVKTGTPEKDSWKASFIYNADRRTGNAYDPRTEAFQISLGSHIITVPAGAMTVKNGNFSYKTPKTNPPTLPIVNVKITPSKQVIQIQTSKDTINETFPGEARGTLILGNNHSYRVDEFNDTSGKFIVTSGYRTTCMVVDTASITVKGDKPDIASFKLFFTDPEFTFAQGDTVSIKVVSGDKTLFEKIFSQFLTVKSTIDSKSGMKYYAIKNSVKDTSATVTLKKFDYSSKTGKMTLSMTGLDLNGLLTAENQVSFELTIRDKTYFTSASIFETNTGSEKYSQKIP